jgi:adenylate cyclase
VGDCPSCVQRVWGYRGRMSLTRSPEIEAVARRVLATWNRGDAEAMSNLFSSSADLRVLGFDADEQWRGADDFLTVFSAQMDEIPEWRIENHDAEAFEDGSFGWATLHSTIATPEGETPMRHTAVFRLEGGVWRVVQWHNSVPVPNQQVFGVELTTTLNRLVASVLDDASDLAGASGSEGTATLVFTDIVDSTMLAQSFGDVAWADMIDSHERTIGRIADSHGGTVVKFLGDGSMLVFDSARAAIRAAVELQRSFGAEPYAIRIGIHSGEVIRTANDLLGLTVNKAARVAAAATGGSIMISSTTRDLAGQMEDVRVGEPKIVRLKGISDAHQIAPVEWQ